MVSAATGVVPAMKTGMVASIISYLSAAFFPSYHEMIMPLSVVFLMVWLLIFNKKAASIGEISTSLLGMYYIGYLPSFWVRLRGIDSKLILYTDIFKGQAWMHVDWWTVGSFMTWWTWTSIVVADVSAYFVGKNFGRTKLDRVSSAAGSASPNKTIEGAIAGILGCMLFNTTGAYFMRWPFWPSSGALYGFMISFTALVGDLTASMMKRDAGLKDSGSILPGHGGLLDRIDSYMLTAPASYFFINAIVS
jgi:phosphatidate cytidylyltransferase